MQEYPRGSDGPDRMLYAVGRAFWGRPGCLARRLERYNTGDFRRGIANGYVEKVSAQVNVTVPALQPSTGISSMQANIPPAVRQAAKHPAKRTTKNELHDAFSEAEGDAFARNQPEFSADQERKKEKF